MSAEMALDSPAASKELIAEGLYGRVRSLML